jgi:hypothetical protein
MISLDQYAETNTGTNNDTGGTMEPVQKKEKERNKRQQRKTHRRRSSMYVIFLEL